MAGLHRCHLRGTAGLRAGATTTKEGDILGETVILAARIAGQAKGGEILVSSLLKELTESAGDIRFGEVREVALKALKGKQRVFAVIWEANRRGISDVR